MTLSQLGLWILGFSEKKSLTVMPCCVAMVLQVSPDRTAYRFLHAGFVPAAIEPLGWAALLDEEALDVVHVGRGKFEPLGWLRQILAPASKFEQSLLRPGL